MEKKQPKKWSEMNPQEKKRAKLNLTLLGCIVVLLIGLGIAMYFGHEDPPVKEMPPKAVVYNSEWDASVSQVKQFLKDNLNDPDSYESVEWGPVQQQPETKEFFVRHKYRAKNAFGAVMTYNQLFFMDSTGVVQKVQDWQ